MEAQLIRVGFILLQAITLMYAIAYSGAAIRGVGVFLSRISKNQSTIMSFWVLFNPSILWAFFYFLVKTSSIFKVMIAMAILK